MVVRPIDRDRFMACGMVRSSAVALSRENLSQGTGARTVSKTQQSSREKACSQALAVDRSPTADQCGTPKTKVSMARDYERSIPKALLQQRRNPSCGSGTGLRHCKEARSIFPPNRLFCDGHHSGPSHRKTSFKRCPIGPFVRPECQGLFA